MSGEIKSPRGTVIKTGKTTCRLTWNPGLAPEANARYSRAQKFVDSEVLRHSTPYTPMRSSMLIKSGTLGTKIGSGLVQWIAPYARYQYYGKVMVGPAPKVLTERPLTYNGAPQRGAYWFERMKADKGSTIIAGAKKIAGGK